MVHHHHWKNELCQSKKEIQINSECYWGTEGKTRSSCLGQRYRKDRNQHSIRCSGTLTNWLRFVKPCLVTLQILPLEAWVLFLSMQLAVANGMWAERPCASSSLGLSSHLRFHGAFLLCFCLLIVMRGKWLAQWRRRRTDQWSRCGNMLNLDQPAPSQLTDAQARVSYSCLKLLDFEAIKQHYCDDGLLMQMTVLQGQFKGRLREHSSTDHQIFIFETTLVRITKSYIFCRNLSMSYI